jgi:hypothetical protein
MACTTLKNALEHLRTENLLGDLRTVDPSKYSDMEQKIKELETLFNEKYGVTDSFFKIDHKAKPTLSREGNYTTFRLEPNPAAFKKLDAAVVEYNKKYLQENFKPGEQFTLGIEDVMAHTELEHKGELYPNKQALQEAKKQTVEDSVAFSAPQRAFATNTANAIAFKETLLKDINKRLNNANIIRKTNKSPEVKKEIVRLEDLKTKTEKDVQELKNDPNLVDKMFSMFNKDIATVSKILNEANPTIDNIHYAEDILAYFDVITDYSVENEDNTLVDTSDINNIDPQVREALDKLKSFTTEQKTALYQAKEKYLLAAIDKSEKLKSLFPSTQLEEIKEQLLSPQKDISLVSLLFGTVEEEFSGNETLLASLIRKRLEDSRNRTKSEAVTLIQKINRLEDAAKAKLIQMGYGLSGKGLSRLISEVSYDLFYQKTSQGNKTGRLVSKFSQKWYSELSSFLNTNRETFSTAIYNKDPAGANTALLNKYQWLAEKADFIDLGSIPEIINNPEFSSFSGNFDKSASQAYKQKLISQIGEYEYNKIVERQTELLEDYVETVKEELSQLLTKEGVTSPSQLSFEAINHFNIFSKRRNPFDLINSHKNNQLGRVDHVSGNVSNQYQSHIKYNTFIPKQEIDMVDMDGMPITVESEYYDKAFNKIEAEPDLLKFWEAISEAAEMMNATLSDSNTVLGHNSLLKMGQSTADILLNKNTSLLNKTGTLLKETGQTLKGIFSAKERKVDLDSVSEVSKSKIKTIQEDVNKRLEVVLMKLSDSTGNVIRKNSQINLKTANPQTIEILEKVTGKSITSLINTYGEKIPPRVLKEYLTNQVMEEQTFNLPLMMRAYLDSVSEYKAQKEALPEISIYKNIYDQIKVEKDKSKVDGPNFNPIRQVIDRKVKAAGLEDKRWMSQLRMKTWVNKNVKGVTETAVWGKTGIKNLNEREKEFTKEANKYLSLLKKELETATVAEEIDSISAEISEIEYALENVGETVALSAIYEAVFNKLPIFVGLAYSVKVQLTNRFQGWWQGMINDTGRYWPEGAFYASNAFINRKGARIISPSYRNEIAKTKLLIEKLNVLQDATNELDRAKRSSGVRDKAKVLNPFFLMEYVEWHNQVPQILAVLSDPEIGITDKSGNKVAIFDGTGFPAYNVIKGELVLKPEFDTAENRETWLNFSNQKSSDTKSRISQTIAILNGDYSKTGTTFIKSSTVGRSVMAFKTWLPKQVKMRYGSNQTDLALGGQKIDGAYTGALKTNKSRTAATIGLGVGLGALSITTLGMAPAGIIGGALLVNTLVRNRKAVQDGENLQTLKQMSLMGQALVKKAMALPVNTVGGKYVIKHQDFSSLGLSPEEQQNLHFIVNETVGILYLLLVKLAIKAAWGDDEEEEPKTIGGQPNPYYYMQKKSKEEKERANMLENQITKMINEVSLYQNPKGMYDIVSKPAGLDGWFKNVEKLGDGVNKLVSEGNDDMITGPNAGKSKTMTVIRSSTIPGIFNEWIDGDFESFGFSKTKDKDFTPNEVVDSWFKSDYKKDIKVLRAERKEEKQRLTEYWEKELGIDTMDEVSQKVVRDEIKKLVNQEIKATYPLDIRYNYDENQKRLE